MPQSVPLVGINGSAVTRAADAMLRSLGGSEIVLLLPMTAIASDLAGQLGLADPGVQQVVITPVIARELATDNTGPRRRVEFLVPASSLADAQAEYDFAGAEQMIEASLGISYQGEIFHIEGFAPECFGGTTYVYRVVAVE
jgi:hypothetical protein